MLLCGTVGSFVENRLKETFFCCGSFFFESRNNLDAGCFDVISRPLCSETEGRLINAQQKF